MSTRYRLLRQAINESLAQPKCRHCLQRRPLVGTGDLLGLCEACSQDPCEHGCQMCTPSCPCGALVAEGVAHG